MNFYLKSLILVLSLVFIEPAKAQPRCVDLFGVENREVTPETVEKELLQMQTAWENSVAAHLKAPSVGLFLEAENVTSSYFLHAKFEIHLGMLRGAQLAPSLMRGVAFGHEFGHALFAENFTFEWNGKRTSFKDVVQEAQPDILKTQSETYLKALFSEIKEIQQAIQLSKNSGREEIQRELEDLLREKKQALRQLVPGLARFDILTELTLPLNELFADSLPVLFWKNPQIMTEVTAGENLSHVSLIREQLEFRGNNPHARSLAREFKTTSFRGWKREVKDAYTRMDPARGALWELYMKNLPENEIGLYMKVFLRATDLYVSSSLQKFEIDELKDRNPEEINREFLRFFVEVARREGLPIRKSK